VIHKPARECPLAEPHRRDICGIVRVRQEKQAEGDGRADPVKK
jgi:hypothetical protein